MKITHISFVEDCSEEGSHIQWICDNGKIYNSNYHYFWTVFHPIQFKNMMSCLLKHIKKVESGLIEKEKMDNWVDIFTGEVTEYRYDYKWKNNENIKKVVS